MDDLVEHFSGLGPEDLHPRSVSPPPCQAATPQSPPLVDIVPPPTADLPATTNTTATITTNQMAKASKTHANPPQRHAAQTLSAGHHLVRTLGGDGTMDLRSLPGLPQHHATNLSTSVTDTTANSGTQDDDDDEEAHYIHHFTAKTVSSPQMTPRPHQRRNRFTDLAITNGGSGYSYDAGSSATDGPTYFGEANGYHGVSGKRDRSMTPKDFSIHDQRSQGDLESEGHYPLVVHRTLEEAESANSMNGVESISQALNHGESHPPIPLSHGVGPAGGISHRLHALHQQDMARDELLIELHREVQYLREALQSTEVGSHGGSNISGFHGRNPRAEAAERSLMEARQDVQRYPFVYVLIDGEGYDFHEDLLQSGKAGGEEAARRLETEIQNYLHKFDQSNSWIIMVNIYLDVINLLKRCFDSDIVVSEECLREFMCGFAQGSHGTLFDIVDIGQNREGLSRKIEGLFHLFANNAHCKRVFFGGCHNSGYAIALDLYTGNLVVGPRITLLASGKDDEYFDSLPLEKIPLPFVFRPSKLRDLETFPRNDSNTDGPAHGSYFSPTPARTPTTVEEVVSESEAVAKWQAAANVNASLPHPRYSKSPLEQRDPGKELLLNINDERVDGPPKPENPETEQSMRDRIEERKFCTFYHLLGKCQLAANACTFRHGPDLNRQELDFLENYAKRLPCGSGSQCRNKDCISGHVCQSQPGCPRGPRCSLQRFHEVNKDCSGSMTFQKISR